MCTDWPTANPKRVSADEWSRLFVHSAEQVDYCAVFELRTRREDSRAAFPWLIMSRSTGEKPAYSSSFRVNEALTLVGAYGKSLPKRTWRGPQNARRLGSAAGPDDIAVSK